MNRRGFLKALGSGLATVNLAVGLRLPVQLPELVWVAQDMAYAEWMDLLIAQCMALYRISPEEWNTPLGE